MNNKKTSPSMDEWLTEVKRDFKALEVGMFLVHNGVVRETSRAKVRKGIDDGFKVKGMEFSFNQDKVNEAILETKKMKGVFYIKVWLNEGLLQVGDDIMYILVGGDIRPHVIEGLEFLVEKIKTECVIEIEQKE